MLAELIVAQKGFAAGDAHTFLTIRKCVQSYLRRHCGTLVEPAGRIGMLCGGCAALDYGKLHCPGGPTWLLLLRLERGCRMTGRSRRRTGQEGNGMNLLLVGCTSIVMALGVGVYLGGSVGAQQLQYACDDENGDGFVDATESDMCTNREFDKLAVDKALTAEQLGALGQQRQPLSEVDGNDDGEISREEWIGYVEEQFARATEGTGGRMSIDDYTKWREEGMPQE
jgi:hypothetical protein